MLIDDSTCAAPTISLDTSGFRPGGQVAVTVSCSVSTTGLELIDPPSVGPFSATAFATIDPLRAAGGAP